MTPGQMALESIESHLQSTHSDGAVGVHQLTHDYVGSTGHRHRIFAPEIRQTLHRRSMAQELAAQILVFTSR